jgi:hypothetical protein
MNVYMVQQLGLYILGSGFVVGISLIISALILRNRPAR